MKRIIKYLSGILFSILLLFTNIKYVDAASATISVSSSTSQVVVGNTFTVTIKVSSSSTIGSWEFTPDYDTKRFKLTSGETSVADVGDGKIKSKSYTYKFKAIATGSGTITVKSYGVLDYESTDKMSVSAGKKTIKVISQSEAKASLSKNNYLKSLTVEGYNLNPEFSKDVTEYKVETDANTTTVKIDAVTEDAVASLSGFKT